MGKLNLTNLKHKLYRASTAVGLTRAILHGKNTLGFTLIELLVVVSIIMLLTGGGIAAYNNFNENQILTQAANNLRTDLRLAQSKALSGEKPSGGVCSSGALDGYRVIFISSSPTTYVINPQCGGTIYTPGLPNRIQQVSNAFSGVPLPPTPLGYAGSDSILFKSLGQGTNLSGTLTITLASLTNPSKTTTITVTPSGEIK